jgi:hypothetical protein
MNLFDLMDYSPKEEKRSCRLCNNRKGIKYDSGKTFWYCTTRFDNKTNNGLKKIKLKDKICNLFEEIE